MSGRDPAELATDTSRRGRVVLYAVALLLPIGLFILFGAMLPSGVEIAAAGDVQAPRELVYELLESRSGMARWALWAEDEGGGLAGGVLPGPERGVGAAYGWEVDGEPWGSMTVAESDPPIRIVYDVDYRGQAIRRTLTLKEVGSTTTITWSDTMTIERPMHRWMAIVMDERAEQEAIAAIRAIDVVARALWLERQET